MARFLQFFIASGSVDARGNANRALRFAELAHQSGAVSDAEFLIGIVYRLYDENYEPQSSAATRANNIASGAYQAGTQGAPDAPKGITP